MAIYNSNGTIETPEELAKAAQVQSAQEVPQEEPGWFQPGSKSEAAVRGFANGATLGTGKHFKGLIDKLAGGSYTESVDAEKQANAAAQDANPGSYFVGNVVGSAPSMIAGGAGSVPAVMGKNAAMGAVQGGADDTTGNPVTAAATNASVNALTAGAVGGTGKLLKGAGDSVLRKAGTSEVKNVTEDLTKLATSGQKNPLREMTRIPNAMGGNSNQMIGKSIAGDIEKGGVRAGEATANRLSPGTEGVSGPSWTLIKNAVNGKAAAPVMGTAKDAAGAAWQQFKNAPLSSMATMGAPNIEAGVKTAAKNTMGRVAAKDLVNGGTASLTPNIANKYTQATAQKISQSIDPDGSNFGTIMGFLNQTDPEARAANNPDNPLNKD